MFALNVKQLDSESLILKWKLLEQVLWKKTNPISRKKNFAAKKILSFGFFLKTIGNRKIR